MKRIALALAITVAATGTALAGPPWISIELRPMGGSFILARTFHHGTPEAQPLSGSAEGLINGQRRSVPLHFDHTDESNTFAVQKTWGDAGVWVLNIGTTGPHGDAGAVVGVDHSGLPAFVRFPRTYQGSSRIATAGEITAMLRALDAGQPAPSLSAFPWMMIVRQVTPILLVLLAGGILVRGTATALRRVRAYPGRALAL